MKRPTYLGDGLYAEEGHWPGQIRLYASNGVTVSNEVFLEDNMLEVLTDWFYNGPEIEET